MNKWGKFAQLTTILSTSIGLGVLFYTNMTGSNFSSKVKQIAQLEKTQIEQGETSDKFKKDVNTKIEMQNNVLLEYNSRIIDVESTQTDFLTIIDDVKKKQKEQVKQQQTLQDQQQNLKQQQVKQTEEQKTLMQEQEDKLKQQQQQQQEEKKQEEQKTNDTVKKEETKPIKQENEKPKKVSVTTKDGVNLRSANISTSQSLAILPLGTKLTIIDGPSNKGGYTWYKVKTSTGAIGWVAKDFID